MIDARRLGVLGRLQVVSVDDKATKNWFLSPAVGGKVTPTLIVAGPAGSSKAETYGSVLAAMQRLAGQTRPAGQVSHAAAGGGVQHAPVYAMYVTASCGACAKALQLVASSEKLLRAIEIRKIDGNPQYMLDVHSIGAMRTPILVEFRGGKVSGVFEGPSAWSKLVQIG